MSANVDSEEAQALLGELEPGASTPRVASRDFAQLRRLRTDELEEARRLVERVLPSVETQLQSSLRGSAELVLLECSERNARGLFAEESGPAALLRFRCQGHPGWCRWELAPAIRTLERILGSAGDDGEQTEPRVLSGLERTLLERVLRGVVLEIGAALGLALDSFEAVPTFKHAGTYADCDGAPDPYRLGLELELRQPEGSSPLALALPVPERSWIRREAAPESGADGLPVHLGSVPLDLAVHLGTAELALSDLLALEPGDVVPLTSPIGRPVTLDVDGRAIGLARLGSNQGRLAIRITDLDPGLAA